MTGVHATKVAHHFYLPKGPFPVSDSSSCDPVYQAILKSHHYPSRKNDEYQGAVRFTTHIQQIYLRSFPQAYGVSGAITDPVQVAYTCGSNCPTSTTKDYTPLIVGLVVGLGGGLILLAAMATVLVKRRMKRSNFSDAYLVPSALAGQDVDQYGGLSEAAERGAVRSEEGKASVEATAMDVGAKSAPSQAAEDPTISHKAATVLDVSAPEEVALVDGEVVRDKAELRKEEK